MARICSSIKENEITELVGLESDRLPSLLTLELRENKLTSTKGIKLPNLKSLFIVIACFKLHYLTRHVKKTVLIFNDTFTCLDLTELKCCYERF